jgi:hypothetical protein
VNRRREFSEHAAGVARVRLSGDTVAADMLTAILRAHPAVEILTGDQYDDGRQYLTVHVRRDGGLGRNQDVPEDSLLRILHPDRDEAATAAREPRLLPAPCSDYDPADPAEPHGPCATCDRTRYAHETAAAASAAPWTDDGEGSNCQAGEGQ